MAAQIKIKLISSPAGRQERQKRIVRSLGLTKMNQTVTVPDNPGFRGMVIKVPHLLALVDEAK
jgi:large subunit ribosomal protein L30